MRGSMPVALALLLAACDASDPAAPSDAGIDAAPFDAGRPDLAIDGERARVSARVVWEHFEEDDCTLVEGCVVAPGWRRLLRFETFTPNHGSADFRMGDPRRHPELFEYSACHEHYHYNGYADYRLLDGETEVGRGHKQAFCLMDSEQVSDEPGVRRFPSYFCTNQGISRGWGDSYYAGLDCQWIDVTDVAPGDYTLRIEINGSRTIEEESYDDNVARVEITIPDDSAIDPMAACGASIDGPRDCGWSVASSFDCTPGTRVDVGCGDRCGLGSCEIRDDAMLRVCAGDAPCASREQLAHADDGCGGGCPMATVTCPESGRITALVAPYRDGDTATCVPATRVSVPEE